MKRLLGVMVAVILVLSAVCAAAEGVTFTTNYFTLQLPDGWETDFEDLEKEDNEEELGYFADPANVGLACGVYLVYYEDLKDISLFNLDEETIQDYVDAILEEMEDGKPEYLGTVTASPSPDLKPIPLVLFKVTDEDGEFIYADTITNGYSIQFEFFIMDMDGDTMYPFTDAHIEQIKSILETLQPAT